MRQYKIALVGLLVLALFTTGCFKKKAAQTNFAEGGFDSLSSTEDLAQLPPQVSASNQQASIEILPVETSPVTQPTAALTALTVVTDSLSREQKIQAALKNAGFYNGAIDGKIGPASRGAIEAFQKQNGLTVDGKVGPKTWAALEPYLTGSMADQTAASQTAQ